MNDTDQPAHHRVKLILENGYGIDPRTAVRATEPIRQGEYTPAGWTTEIEQ